MLCTRAAARAAGLAVEGDLAPTHLEPRLRQPAPCAQHPAVNKLANEAVDRRWQVIASDHRRALLLVELGVAAEEKATEFGQVLRRPVQCLRDLAAVLEQRAAPLHAHLGTRHAVAVAGVIAAVHVDPQVRGGHCSALALLSRLDVVVGKQRALSWHDGGGR